MPDFSYAFFVAKSAEAGDVILAANTILLQLWYISAYGIDGFAFAAESLVGKFKGARKFEEFKESIKYTMLWGLGIGVAASIIYAGTWGIDYHFFTDKVTVIEAALVVLIWTIFAPLINSICFIWDGVYIGSTRTVAMRNSMLLSTILFFVPVYFLFEPIVGNHALWLAMTVFMAMRGLTLTMLAPRHIFHKPSFQM